MKSISNVFGEVKIKILRLFIFNPGSHLTAQTVANRAKENISVARREMRILEKEGVIRRRGKGFSVDSNYPYLSAIENLLVDSTPVSSKEIAKLISRSGNVRLIIVAGVFLHDRDARVDMLIVGDHIRQAKLASIVASIEAELGKELRYAAFETSDFQYRLGIYDKLIKDIFDSHHEKVLNKLGI